MSNPKKLVFNSSVVLEIARNLNSEDLTWFSVYLQRICGFLRYQQELGQLLRDKKCEEYEEYYSIRRRITNEEAGCFTS